MNEATGRCKRWWFRVGVAVIVAAGALAACEFGLRLHLGDRFVPGLPLRRPEDVLGRHDPDLGWTLRPGVSRQIVANGWSYGVSLNGHGFRDEDWRPAAESDGFRIVLLGDSFGWGWGVHDGEGFADLLETDLDVDVVNLSVPGYSTDQQLWTLERHAAELGPDLVLLQFSANDFTGNEITRSHGMAKPCFRKDPHGRWQIHNRPTPRETFSYDEPPWYRRGLHRSALGQLLVGSGPPSPDATTAALRSMTATDGRRPWMDEDRATAFAIGQLTRACKDLGAPLVAFAIPPFSEGNTARNEDLVPMVSGSGAYLHEAAAWLLATAERLGFETVSVDDALDRAAAAGEDLLVPDGHWNATAHRLAAESLATQLRRYLPR